MSKKTLSTPNIVAEAVLAACKIFVVFFILNNLFWAIVHFQPSTPRSGDTRVEITQTGNRDITQTINN